MGKPFQIAVESPASGKVRPLENAGAPLHVPAQATGQQDHDADEEASNSSLEVIDEKAAEEAAFGLSPKAVVQAAGTDEEPETRQDQAMASGHDELDPRAASGHGELSPRTALGEGAAASAEVEVSPMKRKAFFAIFAGQGESGKET